MHGNAKWARWSHLAAGAALAFAVLVCGRASAELVDLAPGGFTIQHAAHIAAAPDKIYQALIMPSHWWSSHHTFSGNAANLTLDPRAGGCWCEALPDGGSVQHMTVVYAAPGKGLRLRGAMGPFQTMPVDTVMVWTLTPGANGTDVALSFAVSGYVKDGFGPITQAADQVFAQQIARLKSYVETGSAENALQTREGKP